LIYGLKGKDSNTVSEKAVFVIAETPAGVLL
jgi:hypothetical protein